MGPARMDVTARDMIVFLTFAIAVLPGFVAWRCWRGPRLSDGEHPEQPAPSLVEAAVLRDGAMGSTRWAFAALVCRLAREGHCTLRRTRKRRWVRPVPVVTVDLHADPQALSTLETTVVRQLGRHSTLDGFGFAGSTFRRRTLRDVRTDLVERGWLEDCHRRSNGLLAAGAVCLTAGILGGLVSEWAVLGATGVGLGIGSMVAAVPRYPLTNEGARRRAAHHFYAHRQCDRIQERLQDDPQRAASLLLEALPSLILERIATPQWLDDLADRFAPTPTEISPPSWLRDETSSMTSGTDMCRVLGSVCSALVATRLISGTYTVRRRGGG